MTEAYLRLVEQKNVTGRTGGASGCGKLPMRQVLVDYARQRLADKRGGDKTFVSLDDAGELATPSGIELIALDDALTSLAALDERQAHVVELYAVTLGGLSIAETAATSASRPLP